MSICLKSGCMSQHLSPSPAWFKAAWDRSWQWFQMFTLQISESDWSNLRTWRWKQPGSEHSGRLGHDKISHGRAHNNYGNQGGDKFRQFVRKKEQNRWTPRKVLPRCSMPLFSRNLARRIPIRALNLSRFEPEPATTIKSLSDSWLWNVKSPLFFAKTITLTIRSHSVNVILSIMV